MTDFAVVESRRSDAALCNETLEAAIVGSLMSNGRSVDRTADALSGADFSDGLLRRLYELIVREAALGRPSNVLTLPAFLRDDEEYTLRGGSRYLAELTKLSLTAASDLDGHVAQLRSLATRRRLVSAMREQIARATDLDVSTEALLDQADAALLAATDTNAGAHEVTGAEAITEVLDSVGKPRDGVRCGIVGDIDELIGPMRPKQSIIVAGRPGMAKTATAISLALGASGRGHGVLFVSLEMSSEEIGARMAADLCYGPRGGVLFENIRDRRLNSHQLAEVAAARDELAKRPLRVIDASGLKVGRLDLFVRRYKRRMAAAGQKLELVIVDYLQLLTADERTKSPYEAISEISKHLKRIAKQHGVTVLSLAQLSRQVESRDNKRPQLSDLRDSGQIEQDADAVVFLYRDEYYLVKSEPKPGDPKYSQWQDDMQAARNRIEFICAKRRDGPEGMRTGFFFGAYQSVRGSDFYTLGDGDGRG